MNRLCAGVVGSNDLYLLSGKFLGFVLIVQLISSLGCGVVEDKLAARLDTRQSAILGRVSVAHLVAGVMIAHARTGAVHDLAAEGSTGRLGRCIGTHSHEYKRGKR